MTLSGREREELAVLRELAAICETVAPIAWYETHDTDAVREWSRSLYAAVKAWYRVR